MFEAGPALWISALLLAAPVASAKIIGTNVPAQSLTRERIKILPRSEQPAWVAYLDRSEKQMAKDKRAFGAELKRSQLNQASVPPAGRGARQLSLQKPSSWYATSEASRIADIVVSFQTPAGGWSKNIDMTQHRRAPGEFYSREGISAFADFSDYDLPGDANWNYVGTFDNDATTTELRFLAKIITASAGTQREYRAAFQRGLEYMLTAQYPNGGWPQVWPLQGGYHDGITFNDGAMVNVLELLRDISNQESEFAFVTRAVRTRCRKAMEKGVGCILLTVIAGDNPSPHHGSRLSSPRSVWCQQYDPLTLQAASARNYEMPSKASSESADICTFLLTLKQPSAEIQTILQSAADWFERTKLKDLDWKRDAGGVGHLVAAPGHAPLWSRYYDLAGDRPIFGDRDKTIHDDVSEISAERRKGYGWFNESGTQFLSRYSSWKRQQR